MQQKNLIGNILQKKYVRSMSSTNNTFYLFRHGLATKSTEYYGAHIKSAQLLPEGIQQAERIGEYLKTIKPTSFYSSAYPRCVQTATIIAKIIDFPFQTNKNLNEFDEIIFSDFVKNIQLFFDDVNKKENQHIFICSHAATLTILKKLLHHEIPLESDVITNSPPTGVIQIIKDTTVTEIDINKKI